MSPLVPISELHRNALRQGVTYQGRLRAGQSLTLASRDEQHSIYGIDMGSGCATTAGRTAAKGEPPAFVAGGALVANDTAGLVPLPL